MKKERMTIREVCQDLRSIGMGMSQKAVSNCIADGTFPFGRVLSVTNGRRHILILRQDYEKWKANKILGTIKQHSAAVELIPTPQASRELISTHTFTQEDNGIIWEVIIRSWAQKPPAGID